MIEFKNVIKKYGDTAALDGVGVKIEEQGITCLLGRNGAGKTTFLKCLAGHINADGGEILVNGKRVSTLNMPVSVGFIEAQGKLFNFKIKDLIKYAAILGDGFDKEFALNIAARFKLDLNKRYNHLSFGMRTMATTLLSLAGNSEIIILDEPVLGLDAIMRDRFYNLLQESLDMKPRIIIVSTHLIDEIAKVAGKIIIIDGGKILDAFDITELDEKGYSVTGAARDVENAVKGLNVVSKNAIGGLMTASVYDKRIAAPQGCTVTAMGLQDYFIALVGGEENE